METYDLFSLNDYEPILWTCVNCYCGLCVEGCPAYFETRKESFSARGLSQIALELLRNGLKLQDIPDDVIYGCTECRWCEWNCSQNTPLKIKREGTRRTKVSGATMAELLRSAKVEEGLIPPVLRDILENLTKFGNPYGGTVEAKDRWVKDMDVENEKDTILYVGSMVPYEERATKMAEALINVLKKAGVEFGMLGGKEGDSGALARMLGEEGLFLTMVEENTKTFKENNIREVICLSPHDYDAFISYYPNLDIQFHHYTTFISELLKTGKIKITGKFNKNVIYHDPCYLGRRHEIYNAPRDILKSIPELELREFKKSKEFSFCCGGGGPGLFYQPEDIRMNLTRLDQAKEKEAEIVAVACPVCLNMLDDAVKTRNYEIAVMDIAEILERAL